jgi:hypothetical protein
MTMDKDLIYMLYILIVIGLAAVAVEYFNNGGLND